MRLTELRIKIQRLLGKSRPTYLIIPRKMRSQLTRSKKTVIDDLNLGEFHLEQMNARSSIYFGGTIFQVYEFIKKITQTSGGKIHQFRVLKKDHKILIKVSLSYISGGRIFVSPILLKSF